MKFLPKAVFVLAIFFGLIARIKSDPYLFCQSDLTECKCDYHMGTLMMDCSEMNMENVPNFLEDKVHAIVFPQPTNLIQIFISLGTNTQSRFVQ